MKAPVEADGNDEPREPQVALPAPDPKVPDPGLAWEQWRQEVKDASAQWSRLTEGDLAALEAHNVTLTDLIQARYSLALDEANRQVTSFVEDHQLFALYAAAVHPSPGDSHPRASADGRRYGSEAAGQQKYDHDEHHKSQAPARAIAPVSAVWPTWCGADQHQNQNDQQ